MSFNFPNPRIRKKRLPLENHSNGMEKKLFPILTHTLIGLLLLSVVSGSSESSDQLTTSTTVAVSIVTRKVSSTSVTRIGHVPNIKEKETSVTDSAPVSVSDASVIERPSPSFHDENVAKFQKIKKKILASNLKNGNEKFFLSNDKNEKPTLLHSVLNITEDFTKINNRNDGSYLVRSERTTELSEIRMNQTLTGENNNKSKDVTVEGRSLENGSSRQNTTASLRKKMRISQSATESPAIEYDYESFGEPQKIVNSNQMNRREGLTRFDAGITRPSLPIMPTQKLTPVSTGNTLKNSIKFESTAQTDWVPMVPELLSMRPLSTAPYDYTKLKPATSGRLLNKTQGRQSLVFPSESSVKKESNVVPVRDIEITKTSANRLKNDVDKGLSDRGKLAFTQGSSLEDSGQLPIKFRGAVRYKSTLSNVTLDTHGKLQNESNYWKNLSLDGSNMEIPATGASWSLATLKGPTSIKPPEKASEPVRFPATNSMSTQSNQTLKSQSTIYNDLVVPPENIKNENITKEASPTLKSTVQDNVPGTTDVLPLKYYESTSPKIVEKWTLMETVTKSEQSANESELIIPGSIDLSQSGDSTPFLEIMKLSTPEVETTLIDITTETVVATESPQKLITVPKILKATTENSVVFSASSSNNTDEKVYNSTDRHDNVGVTSTEAFATTAAPAALSDPFTSETPLKDFFEETGSGKREMFTTNGIKTFSPSDNVIYHTNLSTPAVEAQANTQAGYLVANSTSTEFFNVTKTQTLIKDGNSSTKESISSFPTMYIVPETSTSSPTLKKTTKTYTTTSESPFVVITKPATPEVNGTIKNLTATSSKSETDFLESEITQFKLPTSFTQNATTLLTSTTFTTPAVIPTSDDSINTIAQVSFEIKEPEKKVLTSAFTPSSTTASYKLVGQPGSTEEGLYYKNYIPTAMNPREEITEENVPAYLRLTVQAASWTELCTLREPLREAIIKMLNGHNVTSDAVHFLNLSDRNCQEKIEETKDMKSNGTIFLPVNMFLMDKNGDFDKNLSEAFLTIWGREGLDFDLPIRKVDFVTPIVNLTELYEPPLGGSVVAAIVISCIAGICVILLGILFVIMKRRQKRFNYGQRCTPVSLDAYSLDSVSIYNSVRRKGMRASKRSYGNAAFDDPEAPSHPMNFAGLANFSSGKEQLYEEFNIIPQVYPKVEELPERAETKNRYANVIPLPETRVHLSIKDGDPLSDYINANYIRGNKGADKLYIACQAPMESTIQDFWRMIWEQQSKVILMITDLQENGIEKCADYLPPNEVTDNLRLFGDYQVTLKKRDVKDKYIISNLTLKNMETNLWREVTHLWYLGWPDQGVPSEANSLIAFLIEARSQMKTQNGATTMPPAVVHCSPGTGRTGTVIACDLCIREYEQNRMVDIPKCVFNLRRDRAGAVQTKDQYAFIYQVLNVYATKLSGGGIESI